ncbi:hypothetical protein CCACVL1_29864 [Corchorus capsularis]|uniref:Uncharacterized protein n=1 Tax=Corchorus capsularis TaxID=210143 RepID=A0A1R3FZP2_COCAP|nr:hypothetical protein CCACVL1_29864 [Corchorus capsularis]
MTSKQVSNLKGTETSDPENTAATMDAKLEFCKRPFKMEILDDIREVIDQLLAKRNRSFEKKRHGDHTRPQLNQFHPSSDNATPPPWSPNAPSPSIAPSTQWPPQMNTLGASPAQPFPRPT